MWVNYRIGDEEVGFGAGYCSFKFMNLASCLVKWGCVSSSLSPGPTTHLCSAVRNALLFLFSFFGFPLQQRTWLSAQL